MWWAQSLASQHVAYNQSKQQELKNTSANIYLLNTGVPKYTLGCLWMVHSKRTQDLAGMGREIECKCVELLKEHN
jgi:hypothetical protein